MPEGYNTSHFTPYKSMYVNMKRPEIAQVKRDRYDQASAEYDALNRAIGSIQTLGGDEYTKNALKNRVEGRMSSVVGSGAFEYGARAVNDAVTDFASDTDVANAATSYENYQKGEALKAQMRAQGKQIYDFDQVYVGDDPDGNPIFEHRSNSYRTADSGVYQPRFEEKLDTASRVKQLMDGIADDEIALTRVAAHAGLSKEEAVMFLKHGQFIGEDKIRKIAKALTPLYADSQEGLQKFRALTELERQDETAAMAILENDLFAYGKKQVGSKGQYMQNPYAKLLAEQETPTPGYVPTTVPSFEANAENMEHLGWDSAKELFKNGKLDTSITWNEASAKDYGVGYEVELTPKTMNSTQALSRYKKDLKAAEGDMTKVPMVGSNPLGRLMFLKEEYGHLRKKTATGEYAESEEEFLERVNAGLISTHAQIGQVHPYTPDGRRGFADLALGNISNLRIVDMEEGGDKTPKTTKSWSAATSNLEDDKWGWTGDTYYGSQLELALSNEAAGKAHTDDAPWIEIHGINVSGIKPGATEMVLHTPRGTKKMQVSYSDQTTNFFTGVANMAKLIKDPDPKRVENVTLPGMPAGVSHYEMKGSYENQPDGSIQFVPMVKRVFVPTPSNPKGSKDDKWYPMPPNKINEMAQSTMQAFESNFGTFESDLYKRNKPTSTSVVP